MNENDMNLRDYFAGMALRYFLETTSAEEAARENMEYEEMAAVQAYMAADAMMKIRNDM